MGINNFIIITSSPLDVMEKDDESMEKPVEELIVKIMDGIPMASNGRPLKTVLQGIVVKELSGR